MTEEQADSVIDMPENSDMKTDAQAQVRIKYIKRLVMQLKLLKLNHKSLIILRNFLMKNMVLIGIVLLVNNYNSIKENTLTLMFHMRVNTIFSFTKDKWLYCFIKWDDEILMTFYFYFLNKNNNTFF